MTPMAGQATQNKMEELAAKLADATERKKQAEKDIEAIKADMVKLAETYELPIKESQSEYLNTASGYVRVTRPQAPVQRIITAKLRRLIGDDTVFLRVVNLPEFIDINDSAWLEAKEEELVYNTMLKDALEEERPAPKPRVAVEFGKRKS